MREMESLLSEERAKNFRMSRHLESMQQTPSRTMLVESRVEAYQSEN